MDYKENSDLMVSVICITYNHEKYIRQCLESLVSQKTSFRYEVVVHDDCSTDGTADIIREFEEKYPEIIRPVYQKENQHSKGVKLFQTTAKYATGKYVAFCEGDDYWCNENKLQIQVDYMEQHPKCSYCFHDVNMWYEDSGTMRDTFIEFKGNRNFKGPGKYSSRAALKLGVVPLSSIVHRREDTEVVDLTSKYSSFEDLVKTMWLASKGYGYCCAGNMSVYRYNVLNSVTTKSRNGVKAYNRWLLAAFQTYEIFDLYTQRKYHGILKCRYILTKPCYMEIIPERFEQDVRNAKEVYIYGAGRTGDVIFAEFIQRKIPFNGFVVSDRRKKLASKYGYGVYYLSQINKEAMIIPAVINVLMPQIKKNLKKGGFHNICEVFTRCVTYPDAQV